MNRTDRAIRVVALATLIGGFPGPSGPLTPRDLHAAVAGPAATVLTNKTTYRPGDQFTVSVSISNPGRQRAVDAYFGVLLTDGRTALYLTAAGFGRTVAPIARGYSLAAGSVLGPFPVFALTLPANALAVGTYTWFLTLTDPDNPNAVAASASAPISFECGSCASVAALDETPPLLFVPIVDLSGTYDPVTKRLGALNCSYLFATEPNDRWCFNAFGTTAIPGKVISSFDYKVAAGAEVRAATAGTVVEIVAETNPLYPDEFEIHTKSNENSAYLVIYDHVKNVRVGIGSVVSPGTVLGTAGIHAPNTPGARNTFGRVELQVNHILDPRTRRSETACPGRLGTPSFIQAHEAALAAHNDANPAFASASLCLADSLLIPFP